MHIYTLNVGQGQFVVVTGATEAVIIDTYVPLRPSHPVVNVKGALARILSGKCLIGLIITGFDADHFNEVGMNIVLNKYRPEWIMYPKYFKNTDSADSCFAAIRSFEHRTSLEKLSVSLGRNNTRFYYDLSEDFAIEVFSPHADDMNSSNNCSLVCKLTEHETERSYLITGDTENDRWTAIARIFGSSIMADVLAAPHHGSKNGITEEAMALIEPHTVLISAGVRNHHGHPSLEAEALFEQYADEYWATCWDGGLSLQTTVNRRRIATREFSV